MLLECQLWSLKLMKLDVRGRPLFANLVTYLLLLQSIIYYSKSLLSNPVTTYIVPFLISLPSGHYFFKITSISQLSPSRFNLITAMFQTFPRQFAPRPN